MPRRVFSPVVGERSIMSIGRNLSSIGNTISTKLPLDHEGFFDRECPQPTCLGFFKVKPGTGLPNATDCTCPYCGHRAGADQFFSQSQIDYAKANAFRTVADAFGNELESMARRSGGGITYKRGSRPTVSYRHRSLPTSLTCSACTCEYKVEGEKGYCPDCGTANGGEKG